MLVLIAPPELGAVMLVVLDPLGIFLLGLADAGAAGVGVGAAGGGGGATTLGTVGAAGLGACSIVCMRFAGLTVMCRRASPRVGTGGTPAITRRKIGFTSSPLSAEQETTRCCGYWRLSKDPLLSTHGNQTCRSSTRESEQRARRQQKTEPTNETLIESWQVTKEDISHSATRRDSKQCSFSDMPAPRPIVSKDICAAMPAGSALFSVESWFLAVAVGLCTSPPL